MESQIFQIVFQDEDLLVIQKQRPFLSQRADDSEREGLDEFLARTLQIPIFPVHRLDREVLGLMIYAKTRLAADHLSDQFRERRVDKVYWARVRGSPREDRRTLVHYLKKNPKKNVVTVFPRETPGAKRSELVFRVLERHGGETEIYVLLKTGRPHQIRAQLAKEGYPLVGDQRYGASQGSTSGELIQLRSVYLAVNHPRDGRRLIWSTLAQPLDLKFLFAE